MLNLSMKVVNKRRYDCQIHSRCSNCLTFHTINLYHSLDSITKMFDLLIRWLVIIFQFQLQNRKNEYERVIFRILYPIILFLKKKIYLSHLMIEKKKKKKKN